MKYLTYLMILCLICGCNKIKKTVGLESTELTSEDKQKQQEEAQRKLREADSLIHVFTERIGKPSDNGGFQHYEGLTEIDPWGNTLKVDYKQDGINEIMTVRCAGPDNEFETQDDLIRTRSAPNFWGFHHGLSIGQWLLFIWVGSAVLGTVLYLIAGSQRTLRGKRRNHPIAGVFILCLLGPIALFLYVISRIKTPAIG